MQSSFFFVTWLTHRRVCETHYKRMNLFDSRSMPGTKQKITACFCGINMFFIFRVLGLFEGRTRVSFGLLRAWLGVKGALIMKWKVEEMQVKQTACEQVGLDGVAKPGGAALVEKR